MTDHLHVIAPFAEGESGTMVRKWSLSHLSFNSSADDLIITAVDRFRVLVRAVDASHDALRGRVARQQACRRRLVVVTVG